MNSEMKNMEMENNKVVLAGEVAREPVFNHEVYGEGFYAFYMNVWRTSGNIDMIPIIVSDRMCRIEDIRVGALMEVTGQFRSYNKHEAEKNCLVLSVFAREINVIADEENSCKNIISIDGFICKSPVYRKTPLGREIADVLIAVNRPYGKSDYIPCIAWGRNARYVSGLYVGSNVKLKGRIQSRVYTKRLGEDEYEPRVAYEVSISRIEMCD